MSRRNSAGESPRSENQYPALTSSLEYQDFIQHKITNIKNAI